MTNLSKTVWTLSLISLFTDIASEMLYPVMPLYLKNIGLSFAFIGILEGIAEAIASLSKGYFGQLSDASGKKVVFVRFGYALSAFAKPMIALFNSPLWILFSRTLDRFGKGIRTGARDAMLSEESTKETKGTVFGFHRSMDTLGAFLGPILALLYLYFYSSDYKHLFYFAFAPGIFAVVLSFALKEKRISAKAPSNKKISFLSFIKYLKTSSNDYRKLVFPLLFFSLFNSSDFFLLLKAKQIGIDDKYVIFVYIFYNFIYVIFSFPLGVIADKLGLRKVFIVGIGLFSFVYVGMAYANNLGILLALFFLYGIYAAATEGISKAWISNIVSKDEIATAIGTYSAFQSLCLMTASFVAGLIWDLASPKAAFLLTFAASFLVLIYMIIVNIKD